MNVLVLGASGAGKSTLIKAISGTEILTGVGEGQTQKSMFTNQILGQLDVLILKVLNITF